MATTILGAGHLGRLGPRLTALAVLPAVLAGLLIVAVGVHSIRQAQSDQASAMLTQAAERADLAVGATASRMNAYAVLVASHSGLVDAAGRSDAKALADIAVELFTNLRAADPAVRVLEITDRTGRVVMRGHNPTKMGDDKSRVTDVMQALQGRTATGAEVSPATGQLAIGSAVPLKVNGTLIGTVKVASYLDKATAAELARVAGGEAMLLAAGKVSAGTIPDDAVATVPPSLLAAAADGRSESGQVTGRSIRWLAATRPIRDMEGKPAGAILVLLPTSTWDAVETQALVALLLAGGIVLCATLPLAVWAARRLSRPIGRMAVVLRALHKGATGVAIDVGRQTGEMLEMATALVTLRDGLIERQELERRAAAEQAEKQARLERMDALLREFHGTAVATLDALTVQTDDLNGVSGGLATLAEGGSRSAASLASAAQQANTNVQAVASAAEQLTASLTEVAGNVGRTASTAREAARWRVDPMRRCRTCPHRRDGSAMSSS